MLQYNLIDKNKIPMSGNERSSQFQWELKYNILINVIWTKFYGSLNSYNKLENKYKCSSYNFDAHNM